MIQLVRKVFIKRADLADAEWSELPIVPASATIKIEVAPEAAGLLQTSEFKAKLSRRHPWLLCNLIVKILLDDGETVSCGTADLPVRLSIEKATTLDVTFKHKTRADM